MFDTILAFLSRDDLGQLFFGEVIPPALIVIMFGMGLALTPKDIKRVIVFPKAAAIGLTAQLVMLPAIAFALVWLFEPAPAMAVGAIILAACPGGVTSNAYVFSARADIALSITLTAVASFITVFSIPLLTYAALNLYFQDGQIPQLDFWDTVRRLAVLTILPVGAGMAINWRWPERAAKAVEIFRKISFALLVSILIAATIGSYNDLKNNIVEIGLLALTLNLSGMALGYLLSRRFGLSAVQTLTITFEVGVQNLALASVVALAILKRPDLFVFTLIYSLSMKTCALSLLALAPRLMRGAKPEVYGSRTT